MRVADHVVKALADRGVDTVFTVAGGHIGPLLDALGQEPRIKVVCCHHEQACAIAAEEYARVSGKVGVCLVTAGPGVLNALSGVFGAWTDSVPVLVISGQCRTETIDEDYELRQLGDQEVNAARVVRLLVKSFSELNREHWLWNLTLAMRRCVQGRPGPCWLEIPVDVQSAEADPQMLQMEAESYQRAPFKEQVVAWCRQTVAMLREAKRPVILVGSGVRIAGATEQLAKLATRLGVPVVTAWAVDTIASDHPCFVGRQGTIGDRAGNWAVQYSDLLLVIGSRLSIRQVSYNWQNFAPRAKKVWVDIDPAELVKPTVKPGLPICCDAKVFLDEMLRQTTEDRWLPEARVDWLAKCKRWRRDYPVVLPRHREHQGDGINHYHFLDTLWECLADDDVVVCGNSTATVATIQVAKIRGSQRLLSNSGSAAMGWDLPAAVGAAIARKGKRVVCVTGDGSIMMNLQELATIAHHRLPVKIFVLCNGGYASIRESQTRLFGRVVGADERSGVMLPNMIQVARTFGIEATEVEHEGMEYRIQNVIRPGKQGPVLCVVQCDPKQGIEPRVESRRLPDGTMETGTLEDMAPRLPREELSAVLEGLR
ncbi:MAG: thiamine pyrophosphate-binding protein [Patescibacteria group bacterium]|nr:thiamine pyrophosphate-binding protein [Patescibacteria group bacterium]